MITEVTDDKVRRNSNALRSWLKNSPDRPEYEPSKTTPEIPSPNEPGPGTPDVGDPPELPTPLEDPPPPDPEPTPIIPSPVNAWVDYLVYRDHQHVICFQ